MGLVPSPEATAPAVPHWFTPGDPWLTQRMRQVAEIAEAELALGPAIEQALSLYLTTAHAMVLRSLPRSLHAAGATPDLADWPERERSWLAAVADFVYAVLSALFGKRFRHELSELDTVPSPEAAAGQYLTAVWDRLKLMPEIVVDEVRSEIDAAVAAGDSPEQIRQRVSGLLRIDAPGRRAAAEADQLARTAEDPAVPDQIRRQARSRLAALRAKGGTRWFSKVREFARTLAVSVLNAATTAAVLAYTHLTGRKRYRQWWTTRDDRVRTAHRRAHGQTQPVGHPFLVGGVHMAYPGDPSAPPDLTTNCRCSLLSLPQAAGEAAQRSYEQGIGRALTAASDPRGGVGMDTAVLADTENPTTDTPTTDPADVVEAEIVEADIPVLAAGTALPDAATTVGWRGVLAPMGVRSGDNRMLGTPPGAPNSRTLPLPLMYQQASAPGHDNSIVVGNITRVWAQDGMLMGEGRFDLGNETARDVVRQIDGGFHRWVSVALDDEDVEMQYYGRDGQQLTPTQVAMSEDDSGITPVRVFTAWRLMSATLVAEPAFQEASIELLVDPAELDDPDPVDAPPPQQPAPQKVDITAAGPSAAERKKAEDSGAAMPGGRYPITDEASLQKAIKAVGRAGGTDGTDADRNAVRRHIIKRAKALGLSKLIPFYWGADGSLGGNKKKSRVEAVVLSDAAQSWYQSVADAVPIEPPAAWFADPELTGPTKIRVTDEGRIYGHIAPWEQEHAALPGTVPPHDPGTAYAKFHRHPVRCEDGSRVKTGPLAGAGHASMHERNLWAVQQHYDNPEYVLADVVVGEDAHGIWCSGSLRHGVSAYQVMFADRYSFSGDWRNGELLAACLASVPGFHLPADESVHALAASAGVEFEPVLAEATPRWRTEDGEVVALVAAGVIAPAREVAGTSMTVAVNLDPDPEEWGRRIGHGMFAGLREAEDDARDAALVRQEHERTQVALAAQVDALRARFNSRQAAEVERLRSRLKVGG